MSTPFYVAPEQVMKDRADYARKGIARGRSIIASTYENGIVIVAENPSNTLHKVSEIYDRIGFAGVGRYNEFDQLRIQGIRHADLKGFNYSRHDVDALSLANQYAQILGQTFTNEMKPMEVEILVAEIAESDEDADQDQLFHVLYDGTLFDRDRYAVLGGDADSITDRLDEGFEPRLAVGAAVKQAVAALAGPDRTLVADDLEVAVLDRGHGRRTFRRIVGEELAGLVS
jgi:proteasome alpha subunit